MDRFDVIVIGQGYAGLSAAKLAIERGLSTANIESYCMGGLILNLNELDPAPPEGARSGVEVASELASRNMELGVVQVSEEVSSVRSGDDGAWIVETTSDSYAARNLIVASGARLKKLGVPGEAELAGRGVSECADCDGPMFNGMRTVVVGGGDSAFQEALALSAYVEKITMVMQGDGPTARPDLVERASANPKIEYLPGSQVVHILGEQGVEGVVVETAGRGAATLPCEGVFAFIGLEPRTAFLPAEVAKDQFGAVITTDACATAAPGLWAIGAARSGFGGLLSDAARDAEAAIAAVA